jgi:hypothetical protein
MIRASLNAEEKAAVIQQVRRLIWHFHEGKTISTIHFNYEPYAALL